MPCGIYYIQSPSGKMYIGSSENILLRSKVHFSNLRNCRHHSQRLSLAWKKYSGKGFTFSILEICSPEDLEVREQYWIDVLKPRYNRRIKVDSNVGLRKTPEEVAAHAVFMRQFLADNPDILAAQIMNLARGSAVSWADPEHKAARIAAIKAVWTPEKRAEWSARLAGVDKGEAARAARWSKPGASERMSEIANKIWDRRGRKNTPEAIRAKAEEHGWECREIGLSSKPGALDGRVTIYCPKHDYIGTPTIRHLMDRDQGCRFCGFQRSSVKQKGISRRKRRQI